MNRRQFGAALAALGVHAAAAGERVVQVERLQLSANGWMPNNEHLPVLLYHRAFEIRNDVAGTMESAFTENQWPPQWRNGVYDFHHYHSTAHEVLGFASGSAEIMLGGENGHAVEVQAGDVAVLPAGTGHCRLKASRDFLVIGAYPAGQHWDIRREAPDAATREQMRYVPFPKSDPVRGIQGELPKAWSGVSMP